jgi:truncated hemoglobin YjbI
LVLGHALTGMPQHDANAWIAHLVEAANKVRETRDRTTLLRAGQRVSSGKVSQNVAHQEKRPRSLSP